MPVDYRIGRTKQRFEEAGALLSAYTVGFSGRLQGLRAAFVQRGWSDVKVGLLNSFIVFRGMNIEDEVVASRANADRFPSGAVMRIYSGSRAGSGITGRGTRSPPGMLSELRTPPFSAWRGRSLTA